MNMLTSLLANNTVKAIGKGLVMVCGFVSTADTMYKGFKQGQESVELKKTVEELQKAVADLQKKV